MKADADVDAELVDAVGDRVCAADGPGWPIEAGQKPVAGRVDFSAAEAGELTAHRRVMLADQVVPGAITERRPVERAERPGVD